MCGTPAPAGDGANPDARTVGFVAEFVEAFVAAKDLPDADKRAQLFERWQMFELSGPQQALLAAKLVLDDGRFAHALDELLQLNERDGKLRDVAGTVFRLWGLWKSGDVAPEDPQRGLLLQRAVDEILAPFTRGEASRIGVPNIGAMYSQMLAAYVSASSNWAAQNGALVGLTREIGRLLATWFRLIGGGVQQARELRKFVVEQYVQAASTGVWGSRERDVVFQLFWEGAEAEGAVEVEE